MKGDKNLIPSQVSLQNSLFIFFQDTCVSNFIESIREAKMIVSIVCERVKSIPANLNFSRMTDFVSA